ncbi:MAG: metalloregulator ArsR/SmtB family transcription factor [Candidatus Saccharimonadales bacterium]
MKIRNQFEDCLPIFNALGNSIRQELLFAINEEKGMSVKHLADKINLSRPAVSHHLKVLQSAGILAHHKVGRERIYYLSFADALEKMTRLISSAQTSK